MFKGRLYRSDVVPVPPANADPASTEAAPSGALRVGIFEGSPLSMIRDRASGEMRGLGHDLGAEFARWLGVRVDYVSFQRIAEVIDAMKQGRVDFALSNATPARAVDVDFSPTLISLELGYLVAARSALTSADALDASGMRIGVTRGSTSERTLPAKFCHARVVPAENARAAIQMLESGALDVFATNKPTLYEMSDAMEGGRILPGNWGLEHIAIAIPKGRPQTMEALRRFVSDVRDNGVLEQFTQRAGLRGAATVARV
jgi:polar amino acid transport system substrate-binding protein